MSLIEADGLSTFLGFTLASLPVRYLDVPLIFGRLSFVDCLSLLEKVSWHLSYSFLECCCSHEVIGLFNFALGPCG